MNKKFLLISLLAIGASFVGGFFVANALNRTELNSLRADNDRLKAASADPSENQDDTSISDAELRSKIDEADRNPDNFEYQKNLGLALYKYAAMKRDDALLKESVRILDRASAVKKEDFDVLAGLGNAHFDLGYFGKNTTELTLARDLYTQALALHPNDAEVRTDLGLTYFLVDPPDDETAVQEFRKSLKSDPKHAKTLEFMIQSLVRQNRLTDAESYLSQLRAVDPSDEAITGLEAKIAEAKSSKIK